MQVRGRGKLQGSWTVREDGSIVIALEDVANDAFWSHVVLSPDDVCAMADAVLGEQIDAGIAARSE